MLAAKVSLTIAEKMRQMLKDKIDYGYLVKREGNYLFIPLKQKVAGVELVNVSLSRREKVSKLSWDNILTKTEQKLLPRAFDVIGDILILELPDKLVKKEKQIAEAYLEMYNNIKTVVKKSAAHSGVYRTRKVTVLAGENRKETVHRESGLQFKVHIGKMYFSPRLGNERLRIARLVKHKNTGVFSLKTQRVLKKGEEVLVMFSGASPYCCVIAKHSHAKIVYGVEINPQGHKYGLENVHLNKLTDKVKLYCGDVRKVLPRLQKQFDRIVMPLPKTGEEFLPLALKYVKKGGTIHYYAFLDEKLIETEGVERIIAICKKLKKKCKVLRAVKVGQHAPYVWRVCYDVKVG